MPQDTSTLQHWLDSGQLDSLSFAVPYGRPPHLARFVACWLAAYKTAAQRPRLFDLPMIEAGIARLVGLLRRAVEGQPGPVWLAKPCPRCRGSQWEQHGSGYRCTACPPAAPAQLTFVSHEIGTG